MTAEVPRFVKGEPGFTEKLNQLADIVRDLAGATEVKPAKSSRTPARKKADSEPVDAPSESD